MFTKWEPESNCSGKRGSFAIATSLERAWHPDKEARMGWSDLWVDQSIISLLNLDVCPAKIQRGLALRF